jgi:hypothetical protein
MTQNRWSSFFVSIDWKTNEAKNLSQFERAKKEDDDE